MSNVKAKTTGTAKGSKTASTKNEGVNEMSVSKKNSKSNEMVVGSKFLMKVRGDISEYEVVAIEEKAVLLKDEEGNERKFIKTIANSAFNKQDELKAEYDEMEEELDEEELEEEEEEVAPKKAVKKEKPKSKAKAAPVVEEDEDDDLDEDEDEEEDYDDEDRDVPPAAKSKPAKETKEAKAKPKSKSKSKSNKYWENEEPIVSEMTTTEIRFYEEAGKLQLFSKVKNRKANDGSMIIAKGITLDVGDMSEKEAMKVISNIVYAMKDRVSDDRFDTAVEELESLNMEVNPEDYVFEKDELNAMSDDMLKGIMKGLGIAVPKKAVKKNMVTAILEAQEDEE